MVSISIRELSKRFGRQTVLDNVHLDIARGELFFLLGPSGCGKTTLLRHIGGFCLPDRGCVFFDGQDVTRLPAHKRDAGMMFQSYALWPHLNVAQNIAFGLEERRVTEAEIERRVGEALERVQLGGLGARRISELSGGQQQRVALARALVVKPRCLLLDEPLSNLDARLRHDMRQEIRRLCKDSGLTAVYVTHDRDEALSMADRLAVMQKGRLAQTGTPQDVYARPVSGAVAAFIGDVNLIQGTVQACTTAGFYEVHTGTAMLRATNAVPGWNPGHGEKVQLCIRPEALVLGYLLESPNQITGEVAGSTYLGASVQYEVRLANGTFLKVNETHPRQILAPGAPVRTMVMAEDVVMLKQDSSQN